MFSHKTPSIDQMGMGSMPSGLQLVFRAYRWSLEMIAK